MKKKHHTPEQIVTKLRTVEALTAEGATVAEAAKQIGVSEQTIYRWKNQYGQMDRNQAKRLKSLEKENARLKKFLAEKELDIDILKDALEGKRLSHEIVGQARRAAAGPSGTYRRRWMSASGGLAR
jgi:transposase-like protein